MQPFEGPLVSRIAVDEGQQQFVDGLGVVSEPAFVEAECALPQALAYVAVERLRQRLPVGRRRVGGALHLLGELFQVIPGLAAVGHTLNRSECRCEGTLQACARH